MNLGLSWIFFGGQDIYSSFVSNVCQFNQASVCQYIISIAPFIYRELGDAGQRLGASACVMHIRRMAANQMNHYTLQLSNVGDVEAVLCRRGEAVLLTRKFTTYDRMECHRVYKNGGIITEVGIDTFFHFSTSNIKFRLFNDTKKMYIYFF